MKQYVLKPTSKLLNVIYQGHQGAQIIGVVCSGSKGRWASRAVGKGQED